MKTAGHIFCLVAFLVFSLQLQAAEQTQTCDVTAQNSVAPFEVYYGVASNRQTFVERSGNDFGLTSDAIPIVDAPSETRLVQLCDGRLVAVWLPENYGKRPAFLTGRIYDGRMQPLGENFAITETNEAQWEHSVAPLMDGGFVVVWKTQAGKDVIIRGRVFDSKGTPLQKSFDVSSSPGQHGQASVYRLPTSGFAVLWHFDGAVLRIFTDGGVPRTPEIRIANDDGLARLLVPYGFVTKDGTINVFMTYFDNVNEKAPFHYARSYDFSGEARTDIVSGDGILQLTGYQESVERLVRQEAHQLEYRMREYLHKDVMGFRFCQASADVLIASKLKSFTHDKTIKAFVTKFCQQRLKSCGPMKLFEHEYQHCATPD